MASTPSTPQKTIDDVETFTTPQKKGQNSNDMEGYLVNLTSPSNNSRFNFMIQGKKRCLNFVCFEPEQKKQLTNLLGSPVKVSNTRNSSRSTDLTFTRDSEIVPAGQMDFDIIDMENLKIKELSKLALECVITITAQVKSRSKELETKTGLPYRVLSVADSTGSIKVMLWGEEFLDAVHEGSTYTFENMRIKEDKMYGGIVLGTTQSDNTAIKPCADLDNVVDGGELSVGVTDSMKGSIYMVNKKMIDYLSCKKCTKKLEGDISGDFVFCKTCDADILPSKCIQTRVVKVEFEEEGSEKLSNFSIFSNVLDKALNIKSASMKENELRMMLLRMPVVEIRHSKKIILSMQVCN